MFYDIYGLSLERNSATVERFLARFCWRAGLEPLTDTFLQVWPREKYPTVPMVELDIHSIAELTDYAERNPTHGFNFYTQVALRSDIKTVIIKFTYDAKVVFGISITDWGDNYSQAHAIEKEIREITQAYKSYISLEYPPADDEEEFDEDMIVWPYEPDNCT
ncbi:hypothetical protein Q5H93_20350 [Hymenobacter sp. ASUV-10]|uniref:Uncharacterized protein n=1 Tax=Hymenobacter aranciens TaxID=3063996 RepID=A0ABT9BKP7_9BACT|nr:hypothetical protein [Hymenobacter sp. ASUV-10]MDO7877108.1 hypothetical protein [Hymenobacter sp. ASUV-10]